MAINKSESMGIPQGGIDPETLSKATVGKRASRHLRDDEIGLLKPRKALQHPNPDFQSTLVEMELVPTVLARSQRRINATGHKRIMGIPISAARLAEMLEIADRGIPITHIARNGRSISVTPPGKQSQPADITFQAVPLQEFSVTSLPQDNEGRKMFSGIIEGPSIVNVPSMGDSKRENTATLKGESRQIEESKPYEGHIIIDFTTISPDIANDLAHTAIQMAHPGVAPDLMMAFTRQRISGFGQPELTPQAFTDIPVPSKIPNGKPAAFSAKPLQHSVDGGNPRTPNDLL